MLESVPVCGPSVRALCRLVSPVSDGEEAPMSRILCVLAVAAAYIFSAALPARSEEVRFLFGVENGQYQSDLRGINASAGLTEYTVHHATSAATVEWSFNRNFKLRLALGTITSNLDDKAAPAQYLSSTGGAIYILAGAAL